MPAIGFGIGLGFSRLARRSLWRINGRSQAVGAALLPAVVTLTRASTEYLRDDASGGYAAGTVPINTGAVVNVDGNQGILNEGPWTNLLSPRARGANMNAVAPWGAGNVSPTFGFSAGVDGTAGQGTRVSVAAGGYATSYGPYYQSGNYFGQTITAGGHYKPAAANQHAQMRWWDGSRNYAAAATLPLGIWTRVERTATSTLNSFQFTPIDSANHSANGGAAAAAIDVVTDFLFATAAARGPIVWHDGTHAGTRLSVEDGASVFGGALELEVDIGLPSSLRWSGRVFTRDSRTFAELDKTKNRIRVSVAGVECVFPAEVVRSPGDVVRVALRQIGNGKPVAKYAISSDHGATYGALIDLGDVGDVVLPPFVHEESGLDLLCSGTTSQLEGVIQRVECFGTGSAVTPWTTVYASTTGTGNGLTVGAPASLSTALTTARAYLAAGTRRVRILLRGGTYFLQSLLGGPLVLTPADSGLVLEAYPREAVEFSGAVPIDPASWSVYSGTIYQAAGPTTPVRHITVGGARATTARTAVDKAGTGWTKTAENTWTAPNSSIAGYHSPTSARLLSGNCVGGNAWHAFSLPVADADGTTVTITEEVADAANFQIGFEVGKIWAVENARELISAEGDFAHDFVNGVIYYKKRAGDTMATADARLPVLEELVRVVGDSAAAPVTNVQILGITFSDTNAASPLEDGWSPLQATWQGRGQEYVSTTWSTLPAAVSMTWADGIVLGGCTLTRLGGIGLALPKGARNIDISGTSFVDIAACGFAAGGILQADQRPANPLDATSDVNVRSCTFDNCAAHYWASCGAEVYFATRVRFTYCDFLNLPYSALSIGWGWHYADAGGWDNGLGYGVRGWPTDLPAASGDTISGGHHAYRCRFVNCMNLLADGGCIYTVGKQPGTIIEECYTQTLAYAHAFGVYIDNGSDSIVARNMVVPAGGIRFQVFAPKATNCQVLDSWSVQDAVAPGVGGVDATNVVSGMTWYVASPPTTWPTGAQAVINAAGR